MNILNQFINSSYGRIALHFLFWLVVLLMNPVAFSPHWGTFEELFWDELINLPHKIIFVYFYLYFLIPRFVFTQKYLSAGLGLLLSAMGLYLIRNQTYIFTENWVYGYDFPQGYFPPAKVLRGVFRDYAIIFLALMIQLIKTAYRQQQANQQLKQEKLEAELKFLKAQLHPHFLFNTLNNLYVLALKKSEHTPEAIMTLSELLDYILYECNAETIALQKEIICIENYIKLEQLRYGNRLHIQFDKPDKIPEMQVLPLLLLPFVENAFKHGASKALRKACIKIDLHLNEKHLIFKINNSKSPQAPENLKKHREGIGLKNIQKRLDLLYQGKYSLKIEDLEESYSVELEIELRE